MAQQGSPLSRAKPMPTSGQCMAGFHDRCPGPLLREARTTPKGAELRELICPCKCGHPKTEETAK